MLHRIYRCCAVVEQLLGVKCCCEFVNAASIKFIAFANPVDLLMIR